MIKDMLTKLAATATCGLILTTFTLTGPALAKEQKSQSNGPSSSSDKIKAQFDAIKKGRTDKSVAKQPDSDKGKKSDKPNTKGRDTVEKSTSKSGPARASDPVTGTDKGTARVDGKKQQPHPQASTPTGPGRPGGGTPGSEGKGSNPVAVGPARTGTPETGSGKTATGNPPPTSSPLDGPKNNQISGVSVGPGRPVDAGGGSLKTGLGDGQKAPGSTSRRDPGTTPAATDGNDDPPAKNRTTKTVKPADDGDANPGKAKPDEAKSAAAGAPAAARALAAPAAATTAGGVAAGAAGAATAAVYSHNNSTMKFVPDGDAVKVVYDKPRSGLGALGIAPGTPLFEGKKTGASTYAGEATTFSKNCGAAKFPVAGDEQGGTVTLRGQKPLRDGDCNVTGYTSETLVFEKGK